MKLIKINKKTNIINTTSSKFNFLFFLAE